MDVSQYASLRSFLGVLGQVQKLLGPTYVDNYLSFWKYSPIFLFLIQPHLGPLLHFFGPLGLFLLALWSFSCGQGQVQKHFWNLPM